MEKPKEVTSLCEVKASFNVQKKQQINEEHDTVYNYYIHTHTHQTIYYARHLVFVGVISF